MTSLSRFDGKLTRAEFDRLYTNVFCPTGPLPTNPPVRFAESTTNAPAATPIVLKKICLDPGHIGGEFAKIEERWFQRGEDKPVMEAELNLIVSRMLADKLRQAGVEVAFTKEKLEPVTAQRPEDFPVIVDKKQRELMFYRTAEIGSRARIVNETIKPDLTLSVHFNAAVWDEEQNLVEDNRLLFFVHGNYLPAEIADGSQQLRMYQKLLSGVHATELAVAESIAGEFVKATGLPAAEYPAPVGKTGYVFARNLAANRLFDGPVIYLEPYYANNKIVYQRIQLGDYEGEKEIGGKKYRSIYREYVDAVFAGLRPFLPKR